MDGFGYRDKLLKTFEEIPREKQDRGVSVEETGRKRAEKDIDRLLETYKEVPREGQKKPGQVLEDANGRQKEEQAIRDMRRILYFIEKKIRGTLAEADQQEIKASTEQWEESMKVLCKYAESE